MFPQVGISQKGIERVRKAGVVPSVACWNWGVLSGFLSQACTDLQEPPETLFSLN